MDSVSVADRPLWILDDGGVALGGGQLFALRLATSNEREVTIVCPAGSPMSVAGRAAGVPVVDVPFPDPVPVRAIALLGAAARLRRVMPADAVVVSGSIRASLVAGLAMMSNPLVHLMHERDSAERRAVRVAFRRSRGVVVVGGAAARAYRRALPRARVFAVNNFLTATTLQAFADAGRLRATRPARRPPVLGVLARLIPEKGVDVLIEELACVPTAWRRLLVAGARQSEAYARGIEVCIAKHGLGDRIALLGERDDVPDLMTKMDVLVVPSIGNEGQPTVILEALAAGLPVIARTPAASEDFKGLPVSGYDGAAALARALSELPSQRPDLAMLSERFGVDQVLNALNLAVSEGPAGAMS